MNEEHDTCEQCGAQIIVTEATCDHGHFCTQEHFNDYHDGAFCPSL